MVQPVLRVVKLSKHFDGLKAVDEVSFQVLPRTITSLIGPNGAGKTTIFNVISGLLPATAGEVYYSGNKIDGEPPQKIARLGLGRTFQEPRLFNHMSVLENVQVGFPNQSGERLLAALLRTSKLKREEAENREKAMEILKFVGLADRAHELAENLAYGQQRFLSVARVLATNPELLLMDEPTVGLHPEEIHRLMELLTRTVQERSQTILLIEHNMDVVMASSHWVCLLVEGRIVAAGTADEIKEHPKLWEAYLGSGATTLGKGSP